MTTRAQHPQRQGGSVVQLKPDRERGVRARGPELNKAQLAEMLAEAWLSTARLPKRKTRNGVDGQTQRKAKGAALSRESATPTSVAKGGRSARYPEQRLKRFGL